MNTNERPDAQASMSIIEILKEKEKRLKMRVASQFENKYSLEIS
jgi:hypothetical protein